MLAVNIVSVAYGLLLITCGACLQASEDSIVGQVFYYFFISVVIATSVYIEFKRPADMDIKTIQYYRTLASAVVVGMGFSFMMWYYKPHLAFSTGVASQLFLAIPHIILFGVSTSNMYEQQERIEDKG